MTVPTVNAFINFSTGPSFAQSMILDQGILDTNILGNATDIIVDVSDQVNGITTRRGRNAEADQFQTGTCTMRIVDQNGDFNPMNISGPYYGLLEPMRKLQITATYNGITYPVFSGFITGYSTQTPQESNDNVAYTTITAVDAFRLAQNAQISTVAGTSAGQLSGQRINNLLDAISWPATMRDVDAGQTTMQADPGTARTALAACQTVATSEYGAFYVDATGSFVFQDRALTSSSIGATPTVFSDNATPGILYFDAAWVLNDVLVYNQANITRTGGTTQTTINQPSIDKYFLHSYTQTDLLMETDAVALQYGQAYVASRAETTVRCDGIVLDLYTENYDTGIVAALSLDFFDPITIITQQPGNTQLEKTLQIFGVGMTINPNKWRVNFTTLEPIIDAFILDNTQYGILDTSTLSY
jgi:hypothetical protein